jgi:hypothetical protein
MRHRFLLGSTGWTGFALSALAVATVQTLLTLGIASRICHSYEGDATTYWLIPTVVIISGSVFGAAMPAMGWLLAALGQSLAMIAWMVWTASPGTHFPFVPEMHLSPVFATLSAGATGILLLPSRWRTVNTDELVNPPAVPLDAVSVVQYTIELLRLREGTTCEPHSTAVRVRLLSTAEKSVAWEVGMAQSCATGAAHLARVRLTASRPLGVTDKQLARNVGALAAIGVREADRRLSCCLQALRLPCDNGWH